MELRRHLVDKLRALTADFAYDGRDGAHQPLRSVPTRFRGHLERGREWAGASGNCWVYTEDLRSTSRAANDLLPRLERACTENEQLAASFDAKIAALDIETCGFTSAPVFMVGILTAGAETLSFHQAVARDYEEEPALLEWTRGRLHDVGLVVTFNGTTFDLPFLRERFRFHRLPELPQMRHLDLLPVCRRIWKGQFPNCRLQTLEERILGFVRKGDIPGVEIPDVYHAFVSTGDSRHICRVAEHNRLDLISLLRILVEATRVRPKHEDDISR
ncbi:MAG TPA: ribonuclease H-like domain-containing protein [Candidatus Latescibacteria bacterium]|nr:ribonuclease H-like domain-containing protein [Candidatus Latescibacterota bacterium]